MVAAVPKFGNELFFSGIASLSQGFVLTSMILAALVTEIVEQEFRVAAIWAFIAAALSAVGLIHAYRLTPNGLDNYFAWLPVPAFTMAYAGVGIVLLLIAMWTLKNPAAKKADVREEAIISTGDV